MLKKLSGNYLSGVCHTTDETRRDRTLPQRSKQILCGSVPLRYAVRSIAFKSGRSEKLVSTGFRSHQRWMPSSVRVRHVCNCEL